MDKTAIKKYAVWARKELISRVAQKAQQYGIMETEMVDAGADSVNGKVLSAEEMQQRRALIAQINEKGYQQVMEEVAYTWFNRFSALRFMEVNGYLPSHVRVFTDENNAFKPQILAEALHLELDKLDKDKVYALKETEQTEELYKYLLIVQCNALNSILPGMFQTIADYTELLLPDNLLREGSVIEQMISQIPEDNWQDAVQIIGWLYQYYNSEKKDDVFAAIKKNVKITKENIPAATQLFTPDWIVRYMVENSLGRLWVEGHPDTKTQLLPTPEEQAAYTAGSRDPEDTKWHYYLEEAQQEPQVQAQLSEISKQYADLTPEQIKVIDPCCGSGHILAYLFDVLMQIYENYGYTPRDAVASILQNNLYGLDIDDRAAQLAYFAVMMKAVRYDKRFLKRKDEDGEPDVPQPHVYAIEESNRIEKPDVEYFCNGKPSLTDAMHTILTQLYDAKEYGSILTIPPQDWDALYARFDEVADESSFHRESIRKNLLPLVRVAQTLAQKYDVVVTNPPYMGASNMNSDLSEYVKKYYPDSKNDLFAVFIEVCSRMAKQNGYQAMITQHAWMFLSSFEKLREKMMLTETVSMAHLGARAFEEIGGEVVQTTSFVRVRTHIDNYKGVYCRLIEPTTQQGKEEMFLAGKNRYTANQDNFAKIPGSSVAYWLSRNSLVNFDKVFLENFANSREGVTTGCNDQFLRLWYEVAFGNIGWNAKAANDTINCNFKWYKQMKGGDFRRWYGNREYVIDWENNGDRIQHFADEKTGRIRSHNYNLDYNFHEMLTWTNISTGKFSLRYVEEGFVFDTTSSAMFLSHRNVFYVLALMNSCVAQNYLSVLCPTLKYQPGNVVKVPYIEKSKGDVEELSKKCVALSKDDWDSFETSWDFTRHPFIKAITKYPNMMDIGNIYLAECYDIWAGECEERFEKLKANEEELNRIFIDIYGLQDELTPEVEDKDVTVRKADLGRDVRSFISYAVGCMFGRYSPTYDGLAYAGGTWDDGKYNIYKPDADGIIPICDDEYFEDDMMGRFVEFVRVVYGDGSLEDNLRFIANALGGKGQPKEVIRNYFLNDFYADHCKIYQKRPIYWLFDSGKKNGFKCLIYLHRYQPDTIARIRTDYVHEQQARYRTAIEGLEKQVAAATSTSERVKLTKQLNKVQAQDTELHQYEEKVHALADQMIKIDLDDGVKHNYEIFKDVLAKIK